MKTSASKNNGTITIRDIARHLDVAASTVSRALAGGEGIGEERVQQVRDLAAKLSYRPRRLRRKAPRTIGFVIATDFAGQPDDSFQYDNLCEVMITAAKAKLHVHVELIDRNVLAVQDPAFLTERRADALLISGFPPVQFCHRVRDMKLPSMVMLDTVERTGLPCITPDVRGTTEEMVRRLIGMGHKRIAFVSLLSEFPSVVARQVGYRQAMAKAKLDTAGLEVGVVRSALGQGQLAVRHILASSVRPTAIVFVTDRLALGGICEMSRAGLKIVEDISVVGHDNTMLAEEFDPPLTTVDMGFAKTAEMAVNLLLQSVGQSPEVTAKQYMVPTRIIWRASCGQVKRQS